MHTKENMSIAIVGAGAVGIHLSLALHQAGYRIGYVVSRNLNAAKTLAVRCQAKAAAHPEDLGSDITHAFLCVPDQAIKEVGSEFRDLDCVLIHTSGSTDIDVFNGISKQYGVFYPLQSFSIKRDPDWDEIPFFVEGSSKELESDLITIGEAIGKMAQAMKSVDRRMIHLAAVFACNFSNYMLSIAQDLVEEAGQKSDILTPLINETIEKAISLGPSQAQTGPAKRGDLDTIKKHLELLSFEEDRQAIYDLISGSLMKYHKK